MRFGYIGSRSFEAVFWPGLHCSSPCRCRVCCHLIAVMIIFHGHRGYYSDGQSFFASRASFPGVVVLNGGTNLFVCVTSLVPLRLPFPCEYQQATWTSAHDDCVSGMREDRHPRSHKPLSKTCIHGNLERGREGEDFHKPSPGVDRGSRGCMPFHHPLPLSLPRPKPLSEATQGGAGLNILLATCTERDR